jgi:hypothetical protein
MGHLTAKVAPICASQVFVTDAAKSASVGVSAN